MDSKRRSKVGYKGKLLVGDKVICKNPNNSVFAPLFEESMTVIRVNSQSVLLEDEDGNQWCKPLNEVRNIGDAEDTEDAEDEEEEKKNWNNILRMRG